MLTSMLFTSCGYTFDMVSILTFTDKHLVLDKHLHKCHTLSKILAVHFCGNQHFASAVTLRWTCIVPTCTELLLNPHKCVTSAHIYREKYVYRVKLFVYESFRKDLCCVTSVLGLIKKPKSLCTVM